MANTAQTILNTKTSSPSSHVSSCSSSVQRAQDLFIRDWVDIGKCLGFSHTTVEVHAFLYISGQAQCTDDVMARLNMSRGNVSMCLRTLHDLGVIRRLHVAGERKDYFESLTNIWDIVRIVVSNRMGRHFDPALMRVRECKSTVSNVSHDVANEQSSLNILRSRLDDIESLLAAINLMSAKLTNNNMKPSDEGKGGVRSVSRSRTRR